MMKKLCIIALIVCIAEIIVLLIQRWFFAKETGVPFFHPVTPGEWILLIGTGALIVLCILLAIGIHIKYK